MEANVARSIIKMIFSEFFVLLGFLFGEFDGMIKALAAFIVIDYTTGVIAAAVNKKLNSAVGFKGIAKKIFILVVISVANIIDTQVIKSNESILRSMAIGFYIANEGLSILENTGKFIKFPKKLRDFLEQLRDKEDDDGNNEDKK